MPTEDEKLPDDSMTIRGPGGWGITAHGAQTILALLVIVLIFLGYLHHQDAHLSFVDAQAQHQRIEDKFNEMIYVLALPQVDREKLNLSMPDSLRAKTRHRRRGEPEEP